MRASILKIRATAWKPISRLVAVLSASKYWLVVASVVLFVVASFAARTPLQTGDILANTVLAAASPYVLIEGVSLLLVGGFASDEFLSNLVDFRFGLIIGGAALAVTAFPQVIDVFGAVLS